MLVALLFIGCANAKQDDVVCIKKKQLEALQNAASNAIEQAQRSQEITRQALIKLAEANQALQKCNETTEMALAYIKKSKSGSK